MNAIERFNEALIQDRDLSEDEFSRLWRAAYREAHKIDPVTIGMRAILVLCVLIAVSISIFTSQ